MSPRRRMLARLLVAATLSLPGCVHDDVTEERVLCNAPVDGLCMTPEAFAKQLEMSCKGSDIPASAVHAGPEKKDGQCCYLVEAEDRSNAFCASGRPMIVDGRRRHATPRVTASWV